MKKNFIINLLYFYILHFIFYFTTSLDSNFLIDSTVFVSVFFMVTILQIVPKVPRVIINAIVMIITYTFTIANLVNLSMKGNVVGISSIKLIDELIQVKGTVTESISPILYLTLLLPIVATVFLIVFGEKEIIIPKVKRIVFIIFLVVAIVGGSISYNYQLYRTVANPFSYVKSFGLSSYFIRDMLPFTKLGNSSDYVELEINGSYQTNENTGKFSEKKNVVFVMAESLDNQAIDPVYAPTLHKMSTMGINFENYYTITKATNLSEYAALTSLVPPFESIKAGEYDADYTTIPEVFGNNGFCSVGVHSNTGEFYDRDTIYPKLYKFDNKLVKEDLNLSPNADWYPSDVDMFQKSVPFIEEKNCEKMFTYYMTYSGHAPYTTARVYDEGIVEQISSSYPNNDKILNSYIAANMELDKMLESMEVYYTEQGMIEETLFVVVSDHYPYSMSYESKMNEGSEEYANSLEFAIDYYNVPFFIYDPVQTLENNSSYGNNLDILPTLADLMGYEYNSSIIYGTSLFDENFNHTVRFFGHYGYSIVSEDIKYDDSLDENIYGTNEFDISAQVNFQEDFSLGYYSKYKK